MTKIQGIIFDMDGTLIDSEAVYFKASEQAAAELHIPFTKAYYQQAIGLSNEEFYASLHKWFDPIVGSEKVILFAQRSFEYSHELFHKGEVPLKSGAIELLEYCHNHQIKRTVASNSSREIVDLLLEKAKIAHYFDRTFSVDEVLIGKPNPEMHLSALNYLKLAKENTLVIEDSLAGIQSANSAGIPVLMIPDLVSEPTGVQLVAVLDSLFDVIDFMDKNESFK